MKRMMRVSVLGFAGKGWLVVALAFVFSFFFEGYDDHQDLHG